MRTATQLDHNMNTTAMKRIGPLAAALFLAGCSGGGGTSTAKTGVNGTYLYVSVADIYYGTRDVGSSSEETLEIQNRGADRYPLESIQVIGNDADAFVVPIYARIVLEPAQAVRVPVSFEPLSDGIKKATFEVAYTTEQLVDESVNVQEQTYYEAVDLGAANEYRASAARYQDYLDSDPVTVNRRRAAIRIPVVQEALTYGDGRDTTLYMDALAARDRSDPEDALQALDALLAFDSDSYLADDAQYLKAYIALMDLGNPGLALRELQKLIEEHPDSTYYDTAQYGTALAQQELGNDRLAYTIYEDIRSRHTGISALGVQLPKDDLVSRLWFQRASTAIDQMIDSGLEA